MTPCGRRGSCWLRGSSSASPAAAAIRVPRPSHSAPSPSPSGPRRSPRFPRPAREGSHLRSLASSAERIFTGPATRSRMSRTARRAMQTSLRSGERAPTRSPRSTIPSIASSSRSCAPTGATRRASSAAVATTWLSWSTAPCSATSSRRICGPTPASRAGPATGSPRLAPTATRAGTSMSRPSPSRRTATPTASFATARASVPRRSAALRCARRATRRSSTRARATRITWSVKTTLHRGHAPPSPAVTARASTMTSPRRTAAAVTCRASRPRRATLGPSTAQSLPICSSAATRGSRRCRATPSSSKRRARSSRTASPSTSQASATRAAGTSSSRPRPSCSRAVSTPSSTSRYATSTSDIAFQAASWTPRERGSRS